MTDALAVCAIVFMAVVAPIWIAFHYITKWKAGKPSGETQMAQGEQIAAQHRKSAQMKDRVEALEAILDAELPGWRQRQ